MQQPAVMRMMADALVGRAIGLPGGCGSAVPAEAAAGQGIGGGDAGSPAGHRSRAKICHPPPPSERQGRSEGNFPQPSRIQPAYIPIRYLNTPALRREFESSPRRYFGFCPPEKRQSVLSASVAAASEPFTQPPRLASAPDRRQETQLEWSKSRISSHKMHMNFETIVDVKW